MRLTDIDTPALILDRQRLVVNAERMRQRLSGSGVALRPHMKTCKSIRVAEEALKGLPMKATVATLNEAEYFLERGVTDILYAVCIVPCKFERAFDLLRKGAQLTLVVDSVPVAADLAAAASVADVRVPVMVELDCGEHRTGVRPDSACLFELAQQLQAATHLTFVGLMTHAGHAYAARSPREISDIAEEERETVIQAASALRERGISVHSLSVGSTPTAVFADSYDGLTEIRPGVYLFGDLFQAAIHTCAIEDIAVSVLASVISADQRNNRVVLDAGGLALSKDRSTADMEDDFGYGLVCGPRGETLDCRVIVNEVHQEHGEINWPLSDDLPQVGQLLRVLPNHSCMTAAMYDRYHVVDGDSDEIAEIWDKTMGWGPTGQ